MRLVSDKSFWVSFLSLVLVILYTGSTIVSALSADQKLLYESGVHYFDLATCSASSDSTSQTTSAVSGDVQSLAKQILDNSNITYWANAPSGAVANWQSRVPTGGDTTNINTKDVVRALAQGDKAYTTAANAPSSEADINPNILKFILDSGKEGKVMVNALTDKTHSSPDSNHYKGLAVDLDLNTAVPLDKLNEIAAKYGGTKNNETDHHHYDFPNRPSDSGTPADSGSSGVNSIYMVGDSITKGAKSALDSAFSTKNINTYIDGSVSRSITKAGDDPATSGLDALDEDKARIEQSSAVIVALGTNPRDSNFKQSVKDMLDKIQSIKSGVKIYWVNVFSEGKGSNKIDRNSINKDISDVASSQNVTVIDTVDKEIAVGDDNIHPTQDGYQTYATIVADAVNGDSNSTAQPNSCACSEGGTQLTGSDGESRTYNFLIGKGLSPEQAAGIVGNLSVESGFVPYIQEHSQTPPNGGFGIAQWTGTGKPGDPAGDRRLKFINAMKAAGFDVDMDTLVVKPGQGDVKLLGAELDYLWKEATDRGDIAKLKQETTVLGAVTSWLKNFEIADPAQSHADARATAGQDAINKYGSGGGGSTQTTSGSAGCSTGNDSSGSLTGEYSFPVKKKWWDEHPEYFTQPHHLHSNGSPDIAVDIPVPTGTSVYAVMGGKVVAAPNEGGYGKGVTIDSGNGVIFIYGHGSDGGSVQGAKQGDTVKAGQLIMHSDNTGKSTGPHLHITIQINGTNYCPQTFLEGIAKGNPPSLNSLPTSGCSGGQRI